MTVREAMQEAAGILSGAGLESPGREAAVIFCHVLGRDRGWLYSHAEEELSGEERERLLELIGERARGKPVQYITGRQEFMSLVFSVNPRVLIPRPDTEILVETVIGHVKSLSLSDAPVRVLDMGTGSGCIAVSLAFYIENCFVTAVDISSDAIEVARENAGRNGVAHRIEFLCGDLFAPLGGKSFHVIASNPPYIPSQDIDGLDRGVRDYEPRQALDGGTDGLEFYRRIVNEAGRFLESDGLLALEVGRGQAAVVAAMMEKGFRDIKVFKDLAGIERVVTGKLKRL